MKTKNEVTVLIGSGSIGMAIARRIGVGKHILLADLRLQNAEAAAKVMSEAGYDVTTASVDVSQRHSVEELAAKGAALGNITGLIHAAGVSPTQASPEMILHVDLYGTALVLEEFGKVITENGSGVVIASQSGHRLPALTIDYCLTQKGAPETGTAISRKSIAAFIRTVIDNPDLHRNENLGISKPN